MGMWKKRDQSHPVFWWENESIHETHCVDGKFWVSGNVSVAADADVNRSVDCDVISTNCDCVVGGRKQYTKEEFSHYCVRVLNFIKVPFSAGSFLLTFINRILINTISILQSVFSRVLIRQVVTSSSYSVNENNFVKCFVCVFKYLNLHLNLFCALFKYLNLNFYKR